MRYKEITNNTTERGLLNTYTVKATEKIKIDTEIAKLQWPKNEKEKDERKRRYVTELHLAWKTRIQAYYCYMYIDKLCEVARRRQQGGNKMTKKAQMKQ